jgi:hypothetical protein
MTTLLRNGMRSSPDFSARLLRRDTPRNDNSRLPSLRAARRNLDRRSFFYLCLAGRIQNQLRDRIGLRDQREVACL